MTEKIEEATRKQVAEFLPLVIKKALQSYYDYLDNPDDEKEDGGKTKKFKEYHAAGKIAASHIDLLLKLAKWADMPVGNSGHAPTDLQAILNHPYVVDARDEEDGFEAETDMA